MYRCVWSKMCIMLIFFILMTIPKTSTAMFTANGSGIDWGTKDVNKFVSSVILNTLGRRPTKFDLKKFEKLKGQKVEFFLNIIGSQEYTRLYGYLHRVHHVYFNPLYQQNSPNPCNCYYFADNNQNAGLMPSMQYMGVCLPPYKLSYPVARALVEMCLTYDRRSCDLYDCGKTVSNNQRSDRSRMDCSQWSGSEEFVDLKTGKSECGCSNGKVWNTDKTECVSENSGLPSSEEIQNAFRDVLLSQTNCSRWPGSQPIWDEPNNKVSCGCTGNMVWNRDRSACINSQPAALNHYDCSQYPGSIPNYDNNGNLGCACPVGTQWIQNMNRCVDQQEIAISNSKAPTTCQGHTIYCQWNSSGIGKYNIKIKNNSAIDNNKDGICDICGLSTKGIRFINKSGGCKDHNWDPN